MLKSLEPHIDLGSLKFGEPFTFRYNIYNPGYSKIVIHKLIKQCSSCTEAQTSTTQIDPLDVGMISVTFTPGHIGKTTKSISVMYDDNQELKLTFEANVHE